MVGDDVMQFARDPRALGRRRPAASWSSSASARSARLCAAMQEPRLARLSVPAAIAVAKIRPWKIASYGSLCPGPMQ